jgi:hypothetical protein
MVLWGLGGPLVADDHILTIGGGPRPESNQISLENNVQFLQRVLKRLDLERIKQKILFSDGGDTQPDLQFDGQRDPEDLRMLLADIIGPSTGARFDYRSSLLPIVDGTAEPTSIETTLKEYGAQLVNGDRLIVYFTGHGGRARGETPAASTPSPRGRRPSGDERETTNDSSSERGPTPIAERAADADPSTKTPTTEEPTEKVNKPQEGNEQRPSPARPSTEGRGPRREAFANNILHLWKGTDMSVVEWTEKLDELPKDVPVVAVMVQCYSGGFGNFIFKGGNPSKGLAEHPRCGFFSTVPDRVAAGCTPNVNEADYREYSSYFFEALCGESRTGQAVTPPDYDQDGQTSFLEAHAYTVLTARTIDIPVRTTDIYLRQVSKTTGKEGLLTASSPVADLLAQANPSERAVVEGISQEFGLTGTDRAKDVEQAIKAKREEKQRIESDLRRHRTTVSSAKREISSAVKRRWPTITSPWHPETARLVTEEPEVLRTAIIEHEHDKEMKKAIETIKYLSDESEQKELQVVKLERLKYWLETLALAANLKTLDDADKQAGLTRIGELEATFLTKKPPVAQPAS